MSTNNSTDPSEDKSQRQILREGGYDNVPSFMNSYGMTIHNDDDVQEAKEILRRFDEYDKAYANNTTPENDKPDTTDDFDTGPESPGGVRIPDGECSDDEDEEGDEDNGCVIEGNCSYFEWGLDVPEFEGYPTFSDDEEGHGPDQSYDDAPDYGDDADYENYDEDCKTGWGLSGALEVGSLAIVIF
ncbi:uncharacterized protein BDV14DRAFT_200767 [Aspergillus stella-maris]|uniref:uncharacterized protein n=1 Tax=Aspergillus stella-maris TaxID=1810926 RepID=UPI003CCCADB7